MRVRLFELGIFMMTVGALVSLLSGNPSWGELGSAGSPVSTVSPVVLSEEPSPLTPDTSPSSPAPKRLHTASPISYEVDPRESDPSEGYPEIFRDWRRVEIDGIRMTVTDEEVAAVWGYPSKVGSVYFVNREYEQWTWPDSRRTIHVHLDGASRTELDLVHGFRLSVAGKTLLRKGDSVEQARELFGDEQRSFELEDEEFRLTWGRGLKIDYEYQLIVEIKDSLVDSFTLAVPVARPKIPDEGVGKSFR